MYTREADGDQGVRRLAEQPTTWVPVRGCSTAVPTNTPISTVDDLAPTLIRVRRAQRHVFWRISHPYDPGVAVRILCWFPDAETIVALVGGEKAALGDLWYDSAAPRAESAVDQWLRLHPPRDSGG